jgi:acyl-CoA thioesterase-1
MDALMNANGAGGLNRRDCIAGLAGVALVGACVFARAATTPEASQAGASVVLVLGDSLSAEYGLPRGTGWVALMSKRISSEKLRADVVNASVSGDTTSGGKSRLPALLVQHKPSVVVIELGGNDALRGLPLSMTQRNLSEMTRACKEAGAKVVLVGMQVPPNYGRSYSDEFAALYAKVARDDGAALVPFLLKGVADAPDAASLFQADRIHPNERAHPTMLANVWPVVAPLLRK